MEFKNIRKNPEHEGKFIADVGEKPIQIYSLEEIDKDIEEHQKAIVQLQKLKTDSEKLNDD